jgi:hypothetical protein
MLKGRKNVLGFEEGSFVQSYIKSNPNSLASFARFLLANPCCHNLAHATTKEQGEGPSP